MTTVVRSSAGHTVVVLRGEFDLTSVDKVRAAFRAAQRHDSHLVLDLTDLTFVDSSGLSVLVEYDAEARAGGGALILLAPQPAVARALSITGLSRRLQICDRPQEAISRRIREG